MDLLIKSNKVNNDNSHNNKTLCDHANQKSSNIVVSDDNDWQELSNETVGNTENNSVNFQSSLGDANSIAEAIIVISELPFTPEEKVEYIRTLMNSKSD